MEPWRTEKCAICGHGFTQRSWEERHDAPDGLGDVHIGCCPCLPMERPMTAKLPTWQHVDCPTPNGSADLGCSRYAIMADSASVLAGDLQALTRGTAVEFTLTCTGCGHERQAQVWLRANPRGKRARPARSVTEITVED